MERATWMEVRMTVTAELAETVADLLARHSMGRVVLQSEIDPSAEHPRLVRWIGPVLVVAYFPMDGNWIAARKALEHDLWHVGQIHPLPAPEFLKLEEEDWAETWKERYRPIPIGKKLLILPDWLPVPPGDRLLLRIDPGQAFGTGTHPSTQLSLQLLEDHLRPGQRVIDLGCGSGILSLAAGQLGAAETLALDIDEQAVRTAAENVARNGMTDRIRVARGSLADLGSGDLAYWPDCDLLVANILLKVLVEMLGAGLAGRLRPGGQAILAGVLTDQSGIFERELLAASLRVIERRDLEEWSAWVVKETAPAGAVTIGRSRAARARRVLLRR